MEVFEALQKRRSVRKFTGEHVSDEIVNAILRAGMLAPSAMNRKPCEFIVVRDKATIKKLAESKGRGADCAFGADCLIVVLGDTSKSELCIEDCSIAMAYMHLYAASIGIGSCWMQGRLKKSLEDVSTDLLFHEILDIPENYMLEATLCLGIPAVNPEPHKANELPTEKIHIERF